MSDHNVAARRKRQREYYARNRERINAHIREYRKEHPPGQTAEAKEARRRRLYQKQFGITVEDYDKMFAAQGGKCAICKKTPEELRKRRRLAVDHSHKTGRIRGLLCHTCNITVGRVESFKGWAYLQVASPF